MMEPEVHKKIDEICKLEGIPSLNQLEPRPPPFDYAIALRSLVLSDQERYQSAVFIEADRCMATGADIVGSFADGCMTEGVWELSSLIHHVFEDCSGLKRLAFYVMKFMELYDGDCDKLKTAFKPILYHLIFKQFNTTGQLPSEIVQLRPADISRQATAPQ
ncbi:hypothetical protein E2562_014129 [Oryza meyeriana var. granulata]|uniref:Uncharacterized protein n=1 Tax=Oryza meyeriana var. granulata TaxID=110450 RepID=A0A6G1F8H7_9ORYZ|nr:hypothetical protein E2562_014129 [Oryza meyeriana var. granulata]